MPTSRVSRGEGVTGRYEGPWSFLCETIRSLTSPNSKQAVLKIFVLHPKKTFATISANFGNHQNTTKGGPQFDLC
jgi:hypothetical protein